MANAIVIVIILIFMAIVTVIICSASVLQPQLDLKEIVNKAENRLRGKSSEATTAITIVRPKYTRDMAIKTWTQSDDYNVMYITSPARDKGTVYLKRKKEIWYYLPKIERNIKMAFRFQHVNVNPISTVVF